MKGVSLFAALAMIAVPLTQASTQVQQHARTIVAVTPEQVRWFTPTYYKDGRQRAQLFGDSNRDGMWVDRVLIPRAMRALAHTHPHDELITVIQGTWYLGSGTRFDAAKLKGYSAGSFIVIPAGAPHFIATREGPVIVQVTSTGKWGTDLIEK